MRVHGGGTAAFPSRARHARGTTHSLSALAGSQSDRFGEYPKMRELVMRKDQLVAQRTTPPFYLKVGGGHMRSGRCRGYCCPACWPPVQLRRPRLDKLPGFLLLGASALGVTPAASAGRARALC